MLIIMLHAASTKKTAAHTGSGLLVQAFVLLAGFDIRAEKLLDIPFLQLIKCDGGQVVDTAAHGRRIHHHGDIRGGVRAQGCQSAGDKLVIDIAASTRQGRAHDAATYRICEHGTKV